MKNYEKRSPTIFNIIHLIAILIEAKFYLMIELFKNKAFIELIGCCIIFSIMPLFILGVYHLAQNEYLYFPKMIAAFNLCISLLLVLTFKARNS